MRRSKPMPDGIFDPNMTPLIDVSLVLVVILLVATPMAFQSSIAVRQAARAARSAATAARTERVEISVLADSLVRVNRMPVPRERLGETLRPLLAASATRQVVVRCADGVSHGAFVGVLDEAKACGAQQVAVAGS